MAVGAPLAVVLGTRPEAIKMAPVVHALRALEVPHVVLTTGQQPERLDDCLQQLDLVVDHALDPCPQPGSNQLLAHVVASLDPVLARLRPAWVVVHGDTTSTLAGALAATHRSIPVAHVEAGLRTGDPTAPFPEEYNRRVVATLASLHFAPTRGARDHLLAEGVGEHRIVVTGNPVVDALRARLPQAEAPSVDGSLLLVTCHRRETHGAPLEAVCEAVRRLARPDRTIVWPVHPHPEVGPRVRRALGGVGGVQLTEPLGPRGFLGHLQRADLVLTDSGGVQEEAAWLGRPTLVLRRETERPEVLQSGVVRLVGAEVGPIVQAAEAWLARPPVARDFDALGDGQAGPRIARILASVRTPSALDVPHRL